VGQRRVGSCGGFQQEGELSTRPCSVPPAASMCVCVCVCMHMHACRHVFVCMQFGGHVLVH